MVYLDRQHRIVHLAVATMTLSGASASPLPLMVKKIGEGEMGWHNIEGHLRSTLERRRIANLAPNSVVLVRKKLHLLLRAMFTFSREILDTQNGLQSESSKLFSDYSSFPLDFCDVLNSDKRGQRGDPANETVRTASIPCLGYMMRLLYACYVTIPECAHRIRQVFQLRDTCDSSVYLRTMLSILAHECQEEYDVWLRPPSFWGFVYSQVPVVPCGAYIDLLRSTLRFEKVFKKLLEDCPDALPNNVARILEDSSFFDDVRSICYLLALIAGHYRSLGHEELGLAECYYEFLRLTHSLKCFTVSAFCQPRQKLAFDFVIRQCCNFVSQNFITDYHKLAFYLHPAARIYFRDTLKDTLTACLQKFARLHDYTEAEIKKCLQYFEQYSAGEMETDTSSTKTSVQIYDSPESWWRNHIGKRRKVLRDVVLQLLSITGYSGENVRLLCGASDEGEEFLQMRCFLLHREVQKFGTVALPGFRQRQCSHPSFLHEEDSTNFIQRKVDEELECLTNDHANDAEPMLVVHSSDIKLFRKKCLGERKEVNGFKFVVEEDFAVDTFFA